MYYDCFRNIIVSINPHVSTIGTPTKIVYSMRFSVMLCPNVNEKSRNSQIFS